MEEVFDLLTFKELSELVKKGEAIYFRYMGKIPDVSQKDLLEIINGDSNALINGDLYTKQGTIGYKLEIKDWLKTIEAEKYMHGLQSISSNNHFKKYILGNIFSTN
jgi:hypothetical protein